MKNKYILKTFIFSGVLILSCAYSDGGVTAHMNRPGEQNKTLILLVIVYENHNPSLCIYIEWEVKLSPNHF